MQQKFFYWLPIFILALLAYIAQTHIYLHRDVAYLLHATKMLLAGETYAHHIFEPSPPLILYLYIPPIIFAKLTSWSLLHVFRAYIILLALISLSVCYQLFKLSFSKNNFLKWFMMYALAYTFLFLPSYHFGQREHLLLILTCPYLFAAGIRLDKQQISPWLTCLIGIMGGIGFAIKPHFWPALILIESCFIYKNRNILGWVRTESVLTALIIISYVLSILIFYPGYYQTIVPLWLPFYSAIAQPWSYICSLPSFNFCITIIILYFFTCNFNNYQNMSLVLALATAGFLITYLIGKVIWYYHILPATGIASLLAALIVGKTAKSIKTRFNLIAFIGTTLVVFAIPLFFSLFLLSLSIKKYLHIDTAQPEIFTFFEKHPNSSYSYFSVMHDLSALELYTSAKYVGSFPYFQWEIIKYKLPEKGLSHEKRFKPYALDVLSEDLTKNKPVFIIVDNESFKNMFPDKKIDFVKEYLSYPPFAKAWEAYEYFTTVSDYRIYQRKN